MLLVTLLERSATVGGKPRELSASLSPKYQVSDLTSSSQESIRAKAMQAYSRLHVQGGSSVGAVLTLHCMTKVAVD